MLKSALNALTRIHSRVATLKRLGTVDIYSPCRITPANFFRFLRGPEYTTIKGLEFIIPLDSMKGQYGQFLEFDEVPDEGTFKIKIGSNTTTALPFDTTATAIQTAIRLFSGYSNITVTGNFTLGFSILFIGISTQPALGEIVDSTLERINVAVVGTYTQTYTPWSDKIKKGDRIVDGSRQLTVDEIMEMHDLGAQVMAYRVRAD